MKDFKIDGKKILVWLPSPIGDAVMCTPALRALRENKPNAQIFAFGSNALSDLLTPSELFDCWVEPCEGSFFSQASWLRSYGFEEAILFKNSFSSALIVFLAGVKKRIGYYRDGRRALLTDGFTPPKKDGRFEPLPMTDYYVNLLSCIGIKSDNRRLELEINQQQRQTIEQKLPQFIEKPFAVLVPGAAFGASKRWQPENFAKVGDYLAQKHNLNIAVSVAPGEKDIGNEICRRAKSDIINLADVLTSIGELKALIAKASIVISNDTGPRHIAIAFNRPIVTLFGPNDPNWTLSRHRLETQIVSDEPCAPCQKPVCRLGNNICMQKISPEQVCSAADELLQRSER